MNNPTLENVPEKLRSARQIASNIPDVFLDFAEYMADLAATRLQRPYIAETLWGLAYDAKDCIEAKTSGKIPVPEKLKRKMPEILRNVECFYLLIDKISSKEFSEKFRELHLFGNK